MRPVSVLVAMSVTCALIAAAPSAGASTGSVGSPFVANASPSPQPPRANPGSGPSAFASSLPAANLDPVGAASLPAEPTGAGSPASSGLSGATIAAQSRGSDEIAPVFEGPMRHTWFVNHYDSRYRYTCKSSEPGRKLTWAVWSWQDTPAGSYRVEVFIPPQEATAIVEYEIGRDSAGLITDPVRLNQAHHRGSWVTVADVDFPGGRLWLQLGDDPSEASGSRDWCAWGGDHSIGAANARIVAVNETTTTTSSSIPWSIPGGMVDEVGPDFLGPMSWTWFVNHYDSRYRYTCKSSEPGRKLTWAVWSWQDTPAGSYRVEVFIPPQEATAIVEYEIGRDSAGLITDPVRLNQAHHRGSWVTVADVDFPGGRLWLQLGDDPSEASGSRDWCAWGGDHSIGAANARIVATNITPTEGTRPLETSIRLPSKTATPITRTVEEDVTTSPDAPSGWLKRRYCEGRLFADLTCGWDNPKNIYYRTSSPGATAEWYLGDLQGSFQLHVEVGPRNGTGKVEWEIFEKRTDSNTYRLAESFILDQRDKSGWRYWDHPVELDGHVKIVATNVSPPNSGSLVNVDKVKLEHVDVLPEHVIAAQATCRSEIAYELITDPATALKFVISGLPKVWNAVRADLPRLWRTGGLRQVIVAPFIAQGFFPQLVKWGSTIAGIWYGAWWVARTIDDDDDLAKGAAYTCNSFRAPEYSWGDTLTNHILGLHGYRSFADDIAEWTATNATVQIDLDYACTMTRRTWQGSVANEDGAICYETE